MPAPTQLDADRIWNRACARLARNLVDEGRAGDRALIAAIFAHSLTMNGGVAHAMEVLTGTRQLLAARAAFVRYGFGRIASLFGVAHVGGEAQVAADEAYWRDIPNDGALAARFKADLAARPDDYDSPT